MADGERLGASFSIDVTQLRTGLAQANRLIRESESEFKSAAAGMDDWTKSEDGLNAKIKSLSSVTELQKTKVNALKQEYQRLIDNGLDPTSKEAVDLRTKINQEEAALKKNEAELKKQKDALSNLGTESGKAADETEKLGDAARDTEGGFTVMKGAMANLVSQGIAGLIRGVGEAAKAMVNLVKSSVDAFANYEQLIGGVETLFGDSAGKVTDYASNAYKTAGLSANEYMETVTGMSASLIQSLGGDTEKAADYANMAITDMSDNANKMGTDIESLQNAYGGFSKQNYTMLDNLKLGYGGTKSEMERLLADAEKLPSAMGQKFDISNYGDIVQAIHLVQDEMKITGTTAKEASTTVQGSISTMKGAWQNLLAGLATNGDAAFYVDELMKSVITVAENLMPVITQILKSIPLAIKALLPQIPPLIKNLLPQLLSALKELLKGLIAALPAFVEAVVDVIPQLVDALFDMLPTLLNAIVKIVINLITALGKLLPQIVNKIIEVVPQLIKALVKAIPQLLKAATQFLMAIVQALPTIIQNLLKSLPSLIKTIIDGLLNAIPQLIQAAIQLFNAIIKAIPTIIQALVQNLPNIINTIIDGVLDAIPVLLQGAIQLFMAIIQALPTILKVLVRELPKIITTIVNTLLSRLPDLIKGAVQLFMGIIKAIPQILVELGRQMPTIIRTIVAGLGDGIKNVAEVGKNLIRGLWNGISDMTRWIKDKIKGFGKSVVDGLKNFFGIHSPSTLMENVVGKNLALGIGEGFTNNIGKVNDEITGAMNFDDPNINVNGKSGGKRGGVVVYQTNNYSQAHSRFELYKSKQQTAAAVRLALQGV